MIKTSFLVVIGELFFRAETLKSGFYMFKKIFTNFGINSLKTKEILTLGMDKADFIIVIITLIGILIISILKEKNIDVRKEIENKNIVIRWIVYYFLILYVLIFGAYGMGYEPVDPMYADF